MYMCVGSITHVENKQATTHKPHIAAFPPSVCTCTVIKHSSVTFSVSQSVTQNLTHDLWDCYSLKICLAVLHSLFVINISIGCSPTVHIINRKQPLGKYSISIFPRLSYAQKYLSGGKFMYVHIVRMCKLISTMRLPVCKHQAASVRLVGGCYFSMYICFKVSE